MTADAESFFEEVARADSGEPLIVPIGGSPELRIPYTRASSLARFVIDQAHIHHWQMRYLAKGMGKHEDLAALAGLETYSTGYDEPDRGEKAASGKRLDDIIRRVLDRERIHEKADRGTVFHVATEPGFKGYTPKRLEEDVASFKAKMLECSISVLATERFVVNDALRSAGTFDHLVHHPKYGVIVLDKKTGNFHAHEFAVQLAVYANGLLYNTETHERLSLESITEGEVVNREVGLIALTRSGETEIHEIDLIGGLEGAHVAAGNRDYMKRNDLSARVDRQLRKNKGARVTVNWASEPEWSF